MIETPANGWSERALMLFDGDCGMCRRASEWVRKHDTNDLFNISEFQKAPTPPMTPELAKACEKAMHVVTPEGKIIRAAAASLYILERTGYATPAKLIRIPPFIWFAELIYKVVAANRPFFAHYLFRK